MISRGMLDDSDYVAQPLASFPCIVVAAPALLAQWPPSSAIEQFTQLPCISTVDALKGMPWQFVCPDGTFVTVPVNTRYRVNSGEMALKAALAGVGFAMLSELGCRPFLADGRLVECRWHCRRRRCSCMPFTPAAAICRPKRARC